MLEVIAVISPDPLRVPVPTLPPADPPASPPPSSCAESAAAEAGGFFPPRAFFALLAELLECAEPASLPCAPWACKEADPDADADADADADVDAGAATGSFACWDFITFVARAVLVASRVELVAPNALSTLRLNALPPLPGERAEPVPVPVPVPMPVPVPPLELFDEGVASLLRVPEAEVSSAAAAADCDDDAAADLLALAGDGA
jgi:hypothetical protein